MFKRTPFAEAALSADANKHTSEPSVRSSAEAGSYPYFAAVVVNGTVFSEDPEIIVDEDPG